MSGTWWQRALMFPAGTPRRRLVFTLLPVAAVVLVEGVFFVMRSTQEPKCSAYGAYRADAWSVWAGFDVVPNGASRFLDSEEESDWVTLPSGQFAELASAYAKHGLRLRGLVPPSEVATLHKKNIGLAEERAGISRAAVLYEDSEHKVDLRQGGIVELRQRWQSARSAYRSHLEQFEPPWDSIWLIYARGVVCEPDPELRYEPLVLFSDRPLRHSILVGLTALLVVAGLHLSSKVHTAWWAPPFCTWAALAPLAIGVILPWLLVASLGLSHQGFGSWVDLRVFGYLARFSLLLGFGNAATLQLLGVILFLCSWRVRRSENKGDVSLPRLP